MRICGVRISTATIWAKLAERRWVMAARCSGLGVVGGCAADGMGRAAYGVSVGMGRVPVDGERDESPMQNKRMGCRESMYLHAGGYPCKRCADWKLLLLRNG